MTPQRQEESPCLARQIHYSSQVSSKASVKSCTAAGRVPSCMAGSWFARCCCAGLPGRRCRGLCRWRPHTPPYRLTAAPASPESAAAQTAAPTFPAPGTVNRGANLRGGPGDELRCIGGAASGQQVTVVPPATPPATGTGWTRARGSPPSWWTGRSATPAATPASGPRPPAGATPAVVTGITDGDTIRGPQRRCRVSPALHRHRHARSGPTVLCRGDRRQRCAGGGKDRLPGAGRVGDRPVRPAAALRVAGRRAPGQRGAGAPGVRAGVHLPAGREVPRAPGGGAAGCRGRRGRVRGRTGWRRISCARQRRRPTPRPTCAPGRARATIASGRCRRGRRLPWRGAPRRETGCDWRMARGSPPSWWTGRPGGLPVVVAAPTQVPSRSGEVAAPVVVEPGRPAQVGVCDAALSGRLHSAPAARPELRRHRCSAASPSWRPILITLTWILMVWGVSGR